jgi:hypothetical protein
MEEQNSFDEDDASSIDYRLQEVHIHAVRVYGCAMCEDDTSSIHYQLQEVP